MSEADIQFANGHTLMLLQFSKNEETRFYLDAKTPHGSMEQLCRIYENFLLNKLGIINGNEDEGAPPIKKNVEYQLEDVLRFVDQLFDLGAMVYNPKAAGYTCHGKAWIKGMVYDYLKKQAV
jgi:hypothetical protein